MAALQQKRRVFTVSRLNQEVQQALESGFGMLWLQGEMSNFSRPASGHFYFSLKDSQSQIRCAMFRNKNRYVDFQPENGDEVLVRGRLGLYTARGDFQLIVEHMEPAGAGKLQQEFEQRKHKLNELGWFDQASKQALPAMPETIGVVTSPTGAAIRDVLQVLSRRYPQAKIIVYPTLVQGSVAAPNIVKAIESADRRAETDLLLVVRGGGSLEDLWAFNEEAVAAAVRACRLPIVSGVGHEIDTTICDLVADVRAPTPSAAAEMATPDGIALLMQAQQHARSLLRLTENKITAAVEKVRSLEQRLNARHPKRLINDRGQRVDELEARLHHSIKQTLLQHAQILSNADLALHANSPTGTIERFQNLAETLHLRLANAMQRNLTQTRNRWKLAAHSLDTVSPLATLDRGFAVVKSGQKIITKAADVKPGDRIQTQLADGEISSIVEQTD